MAGREGAGQPEAGGGAGSNSVGTGTGTATRMATRESKHSPDRQQRRACCPRARVRRVTCPFGSPATKQGPSQVKPSLAPPSEHRSPSQSSRSCLGPCSVILCRAAAVLLLRSLGDSLRHHEHHATSRQAQRHTTPTPTCASTDPLLVPLENKAFKVDCTDIRVDTPSTVPPVKAVRVSTIVRFRQPGSTTATTSHRSRKVRERQHGVVHAVGSGFRPSLAPMARPRPSPIQSSENAQSSSCHLHLAAVIPYH